MSWAAEDAGVVDESQSSIEQNSGAKKIALGQLGENKVGGPAC
jgi:hypothetical protein